MKKILLILILVEFSSFVTSAQTDRDLLLKVLEQQTELTKRQAVTDAKIEGIQKQMEGLQKQKTFVLR